MKGTYFLGADHTPRFEVRDMQFAGPGPHEVLVRTEACGICGTDIHIYKGEKGSAQVTPPVVLGHEFAGVVEAVGSGVTLVKPGDHVAMDPNMYCGTCMPCRMGKKQNCENLFALGVNVDGGFAQYCMCRDTQVFKVDPALDFDVAAMAEPLACVIHGIDQAGIRPGQSVLVIGGGTIGLLMVQMARLSGAGAVILSEPIALRRKIALEVGTDAVIDPVREEIRARLLEETGRDGADVVIECVGRRPTIEQAFQAAGFGASVLLFGVPAPEAEASLPLFDVYKKELRITGSMINPDTHQRAVNLLNSGRLEIRKLITHHYGLEQMEEALQMQMSSDSIKVMIHPQE
ncbi:zinc-dependent alcohol dehydrogenase family protein [Mordavella massiliensis]|uniref:Zinc-dependent alcohol dehydrogenase family protein n=1 Tax=Mordavella massiliensis TaxID=1871024 RepID=A0A938X8P9_9CLOT|nr:zinc-dependent alcohol dehydrogenase family protein [Mordavella massiliensis]MBM6947264.1 zinc-dependent alcohol dehydrogenase family protein [Mordavella massiliensis]